MRAMGDEKQQLKPAGRGRPRTASVAPEDIVVEEGQDGDNQGLQLKRGRGLPPKAYVEGDLPQEVQQEEQNQQEERG